MSARHDTGSDPYALVAAIYDEAVADTSEDLAARALRHLRKNGTPTGARVLDLACGTGIGTVALARAGYVARGLDLSPAMLARAKERATAAALDIEWTLGDITALADEPVPDAAICLHDSLNHLPPDLIKRAFAAVHALLPKGCLFVLDLNLTPGGRALNGHNLALDLGERFVTFRIETEGDRMNTAVTLFTHDDQDRWTRVDATLEQTIYPPGECESMLRDAGFEIVNTEPVDLVGTWVLKQMIVARA